MQSTRNLGGGFKKKPRVFAQSERAEGVSDSLVNERPFVLALRKAHETPNRCLKLNGWNKMAPAYRRA